MLHRERLVRGGGTRRQAASWPPPHRHVGGRHVVLDDDPLDLVGDVPETGAKPLRRRPRALDARAAFRIGLVVEVVRVVEPLREFGLTSGHKALEGVADVLSDRLLVRHHATVHRVRLACDATLALSFGGAARALLRSPGRSSPVARAADCRNAPQAAVVATPGAARLPNGLRDLTAPAGDESLGSQRGGA